MKVDWNQVAATCQHAPDGYACASCAQQARTAAERAERRATRAFAAIVIGLVLVLVVWAALSSSGTVGDGEPRTCNFGVATDC